MTEVIIQSIGDINSRTESGKRIIVALSSINFEEGISPSTVKGARIITANKFVPIQK